MPMPSLQVPLPTSPPPQQSQTWTRHISASLDKKMSDSEKFGNAQQRRIIYIGTAFAETELGGGRGWTPIANATKMPPPAALFGKKLRNWVRLSKDTIVESPIMDFGRKPSMHVPLAPP